MMIWLDEQYLPWSDDERAALEATTRHAGCCRNFPRACTGGPTARTRSSCCSITMAGGDTVFPLPEPQPHYAEIALRGMSTMVPAMQAYVGKPLRPYSTAAIT